MPREDQDLDHNFDFRLGIGIKHPHYDMCRRYYNKGERDALYPLEIFVSMLGYNSIADAMNALKDYESNASAKFPKTPCYEKPADETSEGR